MTRPSVGAAIIRHDPDATDRYATARAALASIPLSVALIGAAHGGERGCATGTAMYVSFAPPQLAIALHPGSRTCGLVEASGRFSVSILGQDQLSLAVEAGRGAAGPDKFAALHIPVVEDDAGTPAAADALAVLWCRVVDVRSTGDHHLIVGEVDAWDRRALDAPGRPAALLRQDRRYAAFGPWLSDDALDRYPT